jgi:hypothetical protein
MKPDHSNYRWPLIVGLFSFLLSAGILYYSIVRNNYGHLIYVLDDGYIHMAVAKNLVLHGVWGVDKYGFSSATSSPLWILVLSTCHLLFGLHEITPLLINILSGSLLILFLFIVMRKLNFPSLWNIAVLLLVVFCTPLPTLSYTGMEHVLHVLATMLFIFQAAKVVMNDLTSTRQKLYLILLGFFMVSVRYEGMFPVAVICLMLIIKRRWAYALSLGFFSFLPVLIFGIVSMSMGWRFLPNSILLKGKIPQYSLNGLVSLLYKGYWSIVDNPHILALLLAALLILLYILRRGHTWSQGTIMLVMFSATTLMHMLFSRAGWFRYEAYLVTFGILTIAVAGLPELPAISFDGLKNNLLRYLTASVLVILLLMPLLRRTVIPWIRTQPASRNVYEQQYQMGLFMKDYCQGKTVAANDIGAINFLGDIRCIDVIGLSNMEIAELTRNNLLTRTAYSNQLHKNKVEIGVVYAKYFPVPPGYITAGEWTIPNNTICSDSVVTFFAKDSMEAKQLMQNLRSFSSRLPSDIKQSGPYLVKEQ